MESRREIGKETFLFVWIRIPPEKIGEARRFESYFGCGTPEWRYGFESHLVSSGTGSLMVEYPP